MAKTNVGGQVDEGAPVWDWNADTVQVNDKGGAVKASARYPRPAKSQSPSKVKAGIKKPNVGVGADTRKSGKTIKSVKSNKNTPYYPRTAKGNLA